MIFFDIDIDNSIDNCLDIDTDNSIDNSFDIVIDNSIGNSFDIVIDSTNNNSFYVDSNYKEFGKCSLFFPFCVIWACRNYFFVSSFLCSYTTYSS